MLKTEPVNMNGKRSIRLLIDAMLELLEENKFQEISISQLTKHAGFVRNTFYAHFETKEDLLSYYMYTLFEKKLGEELENIELEDLGILYFQVWSENISFLEILMDNDLMHLLNRFSEHFDRYCDEFNAYGDCYISDLALPYMNSIYADTLASIIKNWMKRGRVETVEELNSIYKEFVK